MSAIERKQHEAIVATLQDLLRTVREMKSCSTDSLLTWLEREVDSWLGYAASHQDNEDLSSLNEEIVARFYDRYNVRIEPKDLDNRRLDEFKKVIYALNSAC